MGAIRGRIRTRTILTGSIMVLVLGVAFYSGSVYQHNADQSIASAYNPAQSNGTLGGFSSSSSSSTSSLVAAALSAGNPPVSSTSTSSSSTASTSGVGQTTASSASSTTSVSTPSSSLVGQFVSIANGQITVQAGQGQQTAVLTSKTHIYQVTKTSKTSTAALAVGQRVAIALNPANSSTATNVTIEPASSVTVSVRSMRAGGPVQPGSGGAASTAPSGSRFAARSQTVGTITALADGTLTVHTTGGTAVTIKLASSTAIYRVTTGTTTQLKAGSLVAVGLNSQKMATAVVEAPSGAMVSITAS